MSYTLRPTLSVKKPPAVVKHVTPVQAVQTSLTVCGRAGSLEPVCEAEPGRPLPFPVQVSHSPCEETAAFSGQLTFVQP